MNRILASLTYQESYKAPFKRLQILTLSALYKKELCTFLRNHKDLFNTNNIHDHNTRKKDIQCIPRDRGLW